MQPGKLLSKVLLIDDDVSVFDLLKESFTDERVFLMWSRDPEEGVKKAKIEMPDLVITDLLMPRMNGFDVIKTLKSRPMTHDIDIVLLAPNGNGDNEDDPEFLDSLGIKKYLIKSNHSPLEIANEIKTVLA
jgi:CheY-like chemotaxis protein